MGTASLLNEFPPVRTEEWEQAIRATVTGEEYAAKLIWHPAEGLAVKPYYRAEDLGGLEFIDAAPGEFPFVRGARAEGGWRIREKVEIANPEEANRAACEAVSAGAEAIAFANAEIESASDVVLLLANLSEIPVHFEGLDTQAIRLVAERLGGRPHTAEISADVDPLADPEFSEQLIRSASAGFRPFVFHADEFQESAAGAIEEVGFAVSAGVDFLDDMLVRGLPLERVLDSAGFEFAMGPEFFIQIAKLRAFRMVWAKVVESFGADRQDGKAAIHVRTACWNKTIYDAHVNILRATTEAISAVLGGADSISIEAFDSCYKVPDESSRRLARNTQLILKKEASLSRVADPAGGSYMIEAITDAVATKAWKVFQELEEAGGYRKAGAAGVISSVLEHCQEAREKAAAGRRLVLTGTNRFANAAETALDRVDPARLGSAERIADAFEKLRLRTERSGKEGKTARILLAEIGDAKMRSARSQFVADFLACAGMSAEIHRVETTEQIAAKDADAIVLCSSDPEYLGIVEQLMPVIEESGNRARVLVAGFPESAEQLKKLGVSDFVHLSSNAVEVLARLEEQIGIEG